MGLHACHPQCGWCKPPQPAMRVCEACGHLNSPDAEVVSCEECGGPLPEVKKPTPIQCQIIGQICMNPCGKGGVPPRIRAVHPSCTYHTPADLDNPEVVELLKELQLL